MQGILQSDQTPFSLMFKKYVAENKVLRLGIAAYFNLDNTQAFSGSTSYYNTSVGSLYLTIGKEYQKPIDKRWTWYFGGDSVPFFSFNDQELFQSGTYILNRKVVVLA